jgi:hypothetical protein
MIPVYRIFARDVESYLDFSDEMLFEQYDNECLGTRCSPNNGFNYGKRYMDVTLAMWREDIRLGTLFIHELYQDPSFPHWWLDRVFCKEYSAIFREQGLIP